MSFLRLTIGTWIVMICFTPFAFAQITITNADFAAIGDTIVYQRDTSGITGVTVGSAGANQTWDLSNMTSDFVDTTFILDPAMTPNGADFPNANIAFYETVSDNYGYFNLDATTIELVGLAFELPQVDGYLLSAHPVPALPIINLPGNYQDNFSVTSVADGTSFFGDTTQGPPVTVLDSVHVISSFTKFDTIDGWGTVTTPLATFPCLRQKSYEIRVDSVWGYLTILDPPPVFSFWTFLFAEIDTTITYRWWTNDFGNAMAEVATSHNGTVKSTKYMQVQPPPQAGFSFAYTNSLELTFTDESINNPDTWAWDFGDGNTSMDQHPVHTYGAAGSYDICLIVTNSSGSDTICQTEQVDPCNYVEVGFTAMNTFLQVDFTSATTNIDTWNWDFGDGSNSVDEHPMHTFTAPGSYNVCLTGSNNCTSKLFCDSITVEEDTTSGIGADPFLNTYFRIFPNPTTGRLWMRMNGMPAGQYNVVMINSAGDQVKYLPISNDGNASITKLLFMDDLPDGLYFMMLRTEDQRLLKSDHIMILR